MYQWENVYYFLKENSRRVFSALLPFFPRKQPVSLSIKNEKPVRGGGLPFCAYARASARTTIWWAKCGWRCRWHFNARAIVTAMAMRGKAAAEAGRLFSLAGKSSRVEEPCG